MRGRRKRRGKHEREYSSVCGSSDRYDNRCRVPYNTYANITPTTQPHYYNQESPYPSIFCPVSFRPTQRINITTYTVRRILGPLSFAHTSHTLSAALAALAALSPKHRPTCTAVRPTGETRPAFHNTRTW